MSEYSKLPSIVQLQNKVAAYRKAAALALRRLESLDAEHNIKEIGPDPACEALRAVLGKKSKHKPRGKKL